ncbi:RHS repeat-associated core domain-containing protein, partial [Ralstonia solanacearum]
GQVYDAETGKHYNVNRDYDPAGGRYVQSDPIGLHGGQPSTYGYVGSQPISAIDPSGLATQKEVDAAIATLRQAYPAEFPKPPTSVEMVSMGENGLGMTDWGNNIKMNSDRFNGRMIAFVTETNTSFYKLWRMRCCM